jgi:SRSO17 transposase
MERGEKGKRDVTLRREAKTTVKFVDEYCQQYRDLFEDVRSYEYFKELHIGLISELPRKSLPAIAKIVGEKDSQDLHHFIASGDWNVERLRERRLALLQQALGERAFVLCIDETGDKKKGDTTDYAARQYIGNLGKTENGVVSVNAYGVLDNITFPLLFRIFKPEKRLKAEEIYKSKPELAIELIHELRARGFAFDLVLADRLYGESSAFITALLNMKLQFVVAIRDNHAVWGPKGTRQRQTRWRPFQRIFSDGKEQTRYIAETIFGKRGILRYFWLTTDPVTLPKDTTYLVMTNLAGQLRHSLGNAYGLRTWIEYGFKHSKNELGWADYRLTDYPAIERWWELVFSAYLMVSLQTPVLQTPVSPVRPVDTTLVAKHPDWLSSSGWKHTLNNLRLLIQPFVALWVLLPWLSVFALPALATNLHRLIAAINAFT